MKNLQQTCEAVSPVFKAIKPDKNTQKCKYDAPAGEYFSDMHEYDDHMQKYDDLMREYDMLAHEYNGSER